MYMFLLGSRWGTPVASSRIGVMVRSGSRKISFLNMALNTKMSMGAIMGGSVAGESLDASTMMRAWLGICAV